MAKSNRYHYPSVATDICVFTVKRGALNVLLIERGVEPFLGGWAMPGGFLKANETLEECAHRELREETNVHDIDLELLRTYSKVDRDPRGRVISVAFYALIPDPDEAEIVREGIKSGTDSADVEWYEETSLPKLAFDHLTIVRDAIRTLRQRFAIEGADALKIASSRFTARQLHEAYNCLAPKPINDYSNFWKLLYGKVEHDTTDRGLPKTQPKAGAGAKRQYLRSKKPT
jgi:8-oxo-dGTP diphosphatase